MKNNRESDTDHIRQRIIRQCKLDQTVDGVQLLSKNRAVKPEMSSNILLKKTLYDCLDPDNGHTGFI